MINSGHLRPTALVAMTIFHCRKRSYLKGMYCTFVKSVLEKYDNPLDESVPQTYEALRMHMDNEIVRRRAFENRDDQMNGLKTGGTFTSAFPGRQAKGNGKVLGEKKKDQLCRRHAQGKCPNSGPDCMYSHDPIRTNEARKSMGIKPLAATSQSPPSPSATTMWEFFQAAMKGGKGPGKGKKGDGKTHSSPPPGWKRGLQPQNQIL